MKFKLLRDMLIYIILPVLLFNYMLVNNTEISFQISCSLVIIYSIFTKIKENRINITGLFIFSIVTIYFLYSINSNDYNIYIYNTCICLVLSLIMPSLRIIDKNAGIIVIRDILRTLNKNSLAIIRLIRKKPMMKEIDKISYMIETNLILISLLRIINILIYHGNSASYLNFITNSTGVIFGVVIIYKIIKLVYAYKKLNINSSNKNTADENKIKGKVINFNYFK